jgi:hypothetical protein
MARAPQAKLFALAPEQIEAVFAAGREGGRRAP